MKYFCLMLVLFSLGSCSQDQKEIPSNIKIHSKYQVLDEIISPNHVKCSDAKALLFEEMDKYDCTFILGNYEFDIEKKFTINDAGKLKEYWKYLAEGPLVYEENDFNDLVDVESFYLKILENKKQIIDSGDTLNIDKVFPNQKMILMKKDSSIIIKGRRILYEYEVL